MKNKMIMDIMIKQKNYQMNYMPNIMVIMIWNYTAYLITATKNIVNNYVVTLTDNEVQELKELLHKDGKGYRIKHAQILLKLEQKPENAAWTYDHIQEAYKAFCNTITSIVKCFVTDGPWVKKPFHLQQQNCLYPLYFLVLY